MLVFMGITVLAGFLVCSFSLQKGLERISKIMMIGLLLLIVVFAVNSCLLDGAAEGLSFYLIPDLGRAMETGIGSVITAAMNQAFFTLSLGIAAMEIFGSYMSDKHTLTGEAIRICSLDTFVALMSGLIIFPACFAYGVEPNSGPPLIFETLPNIFNAIPLGRLWGSLFFIFLSFAAFSTVFAVFENIIACTMDLFNISRRKACIFNCIAMLILCLPCVLGFNLLSFIKPFGEGSDIMTLEDFSVSNVLLPLGSLIFVIFCTSRYGWGWKRFKEEANTGKGVKVQDWMRGYMTYVLPVIIFIVFALGMYNFFK
jgi:NSS family neurotransmitter:Na+ symporter